MPFNAHMFHAIVRLKIFAIHVVSCYTDQSVFTLTN
jgi:hypothetical protein